MNDAISSHVFLEEILESFQGVACFGTKMISVKWTKCFKVNSWLGPHLIFPSISHDILNHISCKISKSILKKNCDKFKKWLAFLCQVFWASPKVLFTELLWSDTGAPGWSFWTFDHISQIKICVHWVDIQNCAMDFSLIIKRYQLTLGYSHFIFASHFDFCPLYYFVHIFLCESPPFI